MAKNHGLRYVSVEVLSNQASKQPRTINNALKMQRIHFHKIHDIKNKLLSIIHADKNECSKRDKFFLIQNLELFLEPFILKKKKQNKRSPHNVFSPKTSLPNTRANNLFSKKENN